MVGMKRVLAAFRGAASKVQGVATRPFRMSWALFTWGLIALFFATISETSWFKPAINSVPLPYRDWAELLFALSKEMGFALLIAWGISNFIDRKAREREEEAAGDTRKRIATDVIHAVFGLQHDSEYVRKVVEHALQPSVVRDRYVADYTIENLSQAEVETLKISHGRFVKLTMVSTYTFINVSSTNIEHDVKYSIAVRHGKLLRDFARVTGGSIGGVPFTTDELKNPDDLHRRDGYKSYCWNRTLAPHARLDVVVEAVSIKEFSDNEVWGSFFATIHGLDFKARINAPNLVFGVRTLTATPSKEIRRSETGGDWKIDGPILPNESIVFWWRSPEDDGEGVEPMGSPAV